MNIIYLTTAMSEEKFNSFEKVAKIKINPSNQNFHYKLITALAEQSIPVSVISLRPFAKGMYDTNKLEKDEDKVDNINFYYPFEKINKIWRRFYLVNRCKHDYKRLVNKDTIIIVDTLNLHLIKLAKKLSKVYHNKIIGIVTDNLLNTTNVNLKYASKVDKIAPTLNAYIVLTEELNLLVNYNNKPYYIFEGLVDTFKVLKSPQETPYFFFGGALYERYGILDLIEAFKQINNNNIDLILAGHGELNDAIQEIALKERHIKYLGTIKKEDMYQYEQNAIACINPRKFTNELDKESIPSKILEYLGNKSLVISTPNSKLNIKFGNGIFWCETNDLSKTMDVVLTLNSKEKSLIVRRNNKIIQNNYLKNVQGEKIIQFIKSLS